jgi:hypothetical protein
MKRLALLALSLTLSGCALYQAAPTPAPVPPQLLVSIDTVDGTIGVFRAAGRLHLWIGNDVTSQAETTPPTVHLISYGGETGLTYNSFVFGTAPPGAVRVELAGFQAIGGDVKGGAYVLAVRDKEVLPTQLNWTFLAAGGAVVLKGSNITP